MPMLNTPQLRRAIFTVAVAVFVWLVLGASSSSASSGTSFVYGGCSFQKFDKGSLFESNLNSLLSSLLNSASFSPYNNFTINNPTLYGLYQCRGDVSAASCGSCVRDAVSQLPRYCNHACGGTIQLEACHVRYGNESFVGLPDKTLVLKKCGPSAVTSATTDMLSRRDQVLTGLRSAAYSGAGGGGGIYRAGSVGLVSGMAQCVGDLTGAECADCLSDASEQLKGGCGRGAWGGVYLAKCYARYSAAGVYNPFSSASRAARHLVVVAAFITLNFL